MFYKAYLDLRIKSKNAHAGQSVWNYLLLKLFIERAPQVLAGEFQLDQCF